MNLLIHTELKRALPSISLGCVCATVRVEKHNDALWDEISAHLAHLTATIKPETLAKLVAAGDEPPDDSPPFPIGILPGPGDRYIVTDGPAKGMKGYFVRTPDGDVESVHVGGRLATRVMEPTDDTR